MSFLPERFSPPVPAMIMRGNVNAERSGKARKRQGAAGNATFPMGKDVSWAGTGPPLAEAAPDNVFRQSAVTPGGGSLSVSDAGFVHPMGTGLPSATPHTLKPADGS
jgi:hypothetical protein